MFFLSCVCYAFVCVCLFVPCGHLLGKADLLALICGILVCHFPIGILGQVWYFLYRFLIFAPLLTFPGKMFKI